MSFDYFVPVNPQTETPTYGSKPVLAKSARINVAGGSGGATATDYDLGVVLPKGAQVIGVAVSVNTGVSGGSITASALNVRSGSNTYVSGYNVFATGTGFTLSSNYLNVLPQVTQVDQPLVYSFTHTGAGPATAGSIYLTFLYVM